MHLKKYFWTTAATLTALALLFFSVRLFKTKQDAEYRLQLAQLRAVTKLVIWEQDFVLTDLEKTEREYFNLFKTSESVLSTVPGRMGFHIDLGDSLNTKISLNKNEIVIEAPLMLSYVDIDLSKLIQVKDASFDPTLDISKSEVVRKLNQKALEKYLPEVEKEIKAKELTAQELSLEKLTGKKVLIVITSYPREVLTN